MEENLEYRKNLEEKIVYQNVKIHKAEVSNSNGFGFKVQKSFSPLKSQRISQKNSKEKVGKVADFYY
ncbi:hypothetical protein [Clostridium gasigenes]|uniref:hypothetical protein n=1 Tax=Clostridium gasigenes TaxID=94869 RepID=UPI001C0E1262|nr:hypothetical protein [Clostridium gasigenes]MBU3104552.1 hypothetical protein [Clostridium gasigenes]MBU3137653.1 hypothetical protein [Clostridium gasigenes]